MPKTDPTPKKKPEQFRTTVKKAAMLEALKKTLGVVARACKAVDLERKTHHNWLRDDPDYAAAVADIQEEALDFVEGQLLRKVGDMDTTAIIFYLKTKGKARGYVERVQTQEVKAEPFVLERTVADPERSSVA